MKKILIPQQYRRNFENDMCIMRTHKNLIQFLSKNKFDEFIANIQIYFLEIGMPVDNLETFLKLLISSGDVAEISIDNQGLVNISEHFVKYLGGNDGTQKWIMDKDLLTLEVIHKVLSKTQCNRIYEYIYSQITDYVEYDKCMDWGILTQEKLEEYNLPFIPNGSSVLEVFMCAITTAIIIGEFGRIACNNYIPEDVEFNLDIMGISFNDIESLLDPDISNEDIERMRKKNYVNIKNIPGIYDSIKHVHTSLIQIYDAKNRVCAVDKIYESLVTVFETEEGLSIFGYDIGPQLNSYEYVRSGFTY